MTNLQNEIQHLPLSFELGIPGSERVKECFACVLQYPMSPAAHLLMPRQTCYHGKREQPRPPLKKNGWVSQRIKPFLVELPSVQVKEIKKKDKQEQWASLTFDDLPKIRDKASKL